MQRKALRQKFVEFPVFSSEKKGNPLEVWFLVAGGTLPSLFGKKQTISLYYFWRASLKQFPL